MTDASKLFPGKRIYPNEEGWLPPNIQPGEYGRITSPEIIDGWDRMGWWQCCAPDGSQGSINPEKHRVTEHEDGTITVWPSLDWSQRTPGKWHGWLEKGIWRSV